MEIGSEKISKGFIILGLTRDTKHICQEIFIKNLKEANRTIFKNV